VEFGDLITLEPVKALADTDPELFALLEVFAAGEYEDFEEFKEEHDGWLEDNGMDNSLATRKIRLLTLASLSAQASDRSLAYSKISTSLHIPPEDVEMWVIDVIRAGLVEGKLSQLTQTFLIHRVTYRTFGKEEWTEVGKRLEAWKENLRGVLEVVVQARRAVENQNEKEKGQVDRVVREVHESVLGES